MPSASARSRSPATIRSDRRLGAGIAVSVLLHALVLSLQFGVPGLGPGSGGPITVTLAPDAAPVDAPPVSASVPLAAQSVPPVPAATPPAPVAVPTPAPVPVPAPEPARVNGLRLVDLPPPPPPAVEIAKPASAQVRPKRGKPGIERRVHEVPAPVIVAAPNPDSEFTLPLPEVVPASIPEPAPLLAQETGDEGATPALAQSTIEDTVSGTDDEAEELARRAADEQRQRALEEAQERERIAQQQAADEAQAAQREAQERLARQQLQQQQRQAQEQALLARQEQERVAEEAARAARANDESMRQREAQELASRRLAEQRAAEQAALQAQAAAQERASAEALRLAQAQEQAERQRLEAQRLAQEEQARAQAERQRIEAQRLAREQAERERIEAQHRLAQERARQQADERARADAERLARQQADEAARRSAAERLQAQGPGLAPGSGQPGSSGLGAGGPGAGNGAGSGAGDLSQPGALAGIPGSRARELLRGLTIPGAGVALPAARRDDPRRALADGGERDAPLRLYVDSVRQKLERNAVLGGARLALRDVRIDPLVSLALRSDGSIDEVTIVRSSGRADMDEAVRRFVRLNARYSAFPPNVAARFDVIEIRRIWRFTDGLKLLEEMR